MPDIRASRSPSHFPVDSPSKKKQRIPANTIRMEMSADFDGFCPKIRNIRIAKKNNFPLKKIQDIRKGDKFVNYNGKIVTAAYDASYNSDENCWVVYDESGESYFEDDFNM